MIPMFDPQKTDITVESWVRRVDDLADTYGWDSLTTVRLIANRLCGMARRWYDSQEQLTSNWKNIKKKLIKQFSKPLPFAKLLKEAALYETHNGQDLSEYCFTKLDKLRALKLKIPELHLVDAVISGITNESIARSARASRFTNTNELYSYLSVVGRMPRNPKVDSVQKTGEHSAQHRFAKPADAKEKTVVTCFNCKGPHRARDCPRSRPECYKCGRLGHIAKNCLQRKATPNSSQT
jgi:hypothetical protein